MATDVCLLRWAIYIYVNVYVCILFFERFGATKQSNNKKLTE